MLVRILVPVLLACCVFGCAQGEAPESAVQAPEGAATDTPEDFTLLDAEKLSALLAQSKGKTTIVNLWATWCPPCVAEMPYFAELYEARDPATVHLISLSVDAVETVDTKVRPFKEELGLPFPIFILEDEVDKVGAALRIEMGGALPVTIVYGPDGEVVKLWERPVTLAELQVVVAEAA